MSCPQPSLLVLKWPHEKYVLKDVSTVLFCAFTALIHRAQGGLSFFILDFDLAFSGKSQGGSPLLYDTDCYFHPACGCD